MFKYLIHQHIFLKSQSLHNIVLYLVNLCHLGKEDNGVCINCMRHSRSIEVICLSSLERFFKIVEESTVVKKRSAETFQLVAHH